MPSRVPFLAWLNENGNDCSRTKATVVVIVSVESARDRSLLELVNNVSMVFQKLIKIVHDLFTGSADPYQLRLPC